MGNQKTKALPKERKEVRDLLGYRVERCVIGSCLVSPEAAKMAVQLLDRDQFFDATYADVFALIGMFVRDKLPMTPSAVAHELKKFGLVEPLGGMEEVAKMLEMGGVNHAYVKHWCHEVIRAFNRRKLLEAAEQAINELSHPENDPDSVADRLSSAIKLIGTGKSRIQEPGEVVERALTEMVSPKLVCGRTGFPVIDQLLGNLNAGDYAILAARTSIGKTTFALQVAENNAKRQRPCLFISLEMRDVELINRLLARWSGIGVARIRSRELIDQEIEALREVGKDIAELPLYTYHDGRCSMGDVARLIQEAKGRYGARMFVIDYISFIRPANSKLPRHEQIGQVSKELKRLAVENEVAIICLAQLNREADKERPKLSNLRESGSIEEDADQVIFLYRPPKKKNERTELIVAKNRHGDTGSCFLEWDAAEHKYKEADEFESFTADTWQPAPFGRE